MRKLTKAMAPALLMENAAVWTAEFETDSNNYSRYRQDFIRVALAIETSDKCAYCESYIKDVAPVHVEHIIPKSRRPDLVVDWANLTIACPNCNTKKGSYFNENKPLLNPYRDNPTEHLSFQGSLVFSFKGSPLGRRTIRRVGLDRPGLNQSREVRLQSLYRLLELWQDADADEKDMWAEALTAEVGPDREYSEAGREFLIRMGFFDTSEVVENVSVGDRGAVRRSVIDT